MELLVIGLAGVVLAVEERAVGGVHWWDFWLWELGDVWLLNFQL